MSTVAVVGLGMAGTPGIAARVFSALSAANINLVAIAQGSSELNISFVVKSSDAAVAQKAIHQAFQLSKIGGGRVTHTQTVDVVLLGYGQIGRTLAGLLGKRKEEERFLGAGGGGGGPQRLRVRPPRPARPEAERAGGLEAAGQDVRHLSRRTGGHAGGGGRVLRSPRPGPPGAGRRHRRRDRAGAAGGPEGRAGPGDGQQAPAVGPQVRARRAAVHRRGARPPAAVRGHGGRRSAGAGHPPQAGRIGRQGAEDRGLRLGHPRLPVHRARPGAEVLRGRARGDGEGLTPNPTRATICRARTWGARR